MKHKVSQFYTAPTAFAFSEGKFRICSKHHLKTKVIGSVGEPINEEAWHWYNDNVGSKKCPIVDTWVAETGYHDFASSFYYNQTNLHTLPLPEFNLF
jgi:acetyl-CoA synthetase